MSTKTLATLKCTLVILPVLFLSGCVTVSEQPLYTDRYLIFDSRLVGTWQGGAAADVVWIAAGADKSYVLTDPHGHRLSAHLMRLNRALFLDVEDMNAHHFIARVWIT